MTKYAHGSFKVNVDGQLIECELIGSFNEAGCLAYTEKVKQEVTALQGKPFAMLIDDVALEGGTPEAYRALNEYNIWLNKHTIIAKAFIINSPIQKEIMLNRSPALKLQNIAFFKERKKAITWLNEQLLGYAKKSVNKH